MTNTSYLQSMTEISDVTNVKQIHCGNNKTIGLVIMSKKHVQYLKYD